MSTSVEWKEEICGFCLKVCTGGCSSYSIDGKVLFLFCRDCLDPYLDMEAQKRHCFEMITVIMDRVIDQAGNTLQLPGHA